jgi:serine/threonine protein kinase
LLLKVFGDSPTKATAYPEVAGYEIIEQVDSGGHGSVFRALQTSTGRQVAIKFVSQINAALAKRVETERSALIRADHPNIVTLIDTGYTSSGYYFVYRWMDSNLAAWLKTQEVVPIDRALEILNEVAAAVGHLHSLGILHRDIKPSNVLLDSSGRTKLTDFGIAKELSRDQPASTTTLPLGTPGYMAPEQTGLVEEPVTFETDVYGLGALLYSLLAGRPPFLGANVMQTVQQAAIDDPIPLRRLRPDVPADCETICMKCLNKRHSDRYQSVQQLIDDLHRFRRREPIRAKPVSNLTKARFWMRRHPRIQAWIWTSLFFSAIVISIAWWIRRERMQANEKMAIQTLIEKLNSSNSSELPGVLEALALVETGRLQEIIEQSSAQSPVQRLRLWIASGQPNGLDVEDVVRGVRASDIRDLAAIQRPIRELLSRSSLASRMVDELWNQYSEPEDMLRIASVIPIEKFGIQTLDNAGGLLLSALSARPEAEVDLWHRVLCDFSSQITSTLIHQLDDSTLAERELYSTAVTTTLRWNIETPQNALAILERATVEQLSSAGRESSIFSERLLRLARQRWKSLRSLGGAPAVLGVSNSPAAEADSTSRLAIEPLLQKFIGLATNQSGFFLRVPATELRSTISSLQEQGYCPIGFQVYSTGPESFYTLTFRRSSATALITDACTPDELDNLVEEMKSDGWQPIAIWPTSEIESISVLWHSQGSLEGSISWPRNYSLEWELDMHEGFTAGMSRTLTAFHSNTKGMIGLNLQWLSPGPRLDIPKLKVEVTPRTGNSVRTQINLGDRRVFRHAMHSENNVLHLTIQPCNQPEFLHKAAVWISLGLEPHGVFVDQTGNKFAGFWELNQSESERLERTRAICALVCWQCGDREPVIEELKLSPFPSGRTLVINGLHAIEANPERWLTLADHIATPDELYAWLVAGSNFQWQFANRDLRQKTIGRLTRLAAHQDSAVSLTARWFLREKLQSALSNPETPKKLPSGHRNWFFSPSGIPFIVIDTSDFHLVSDHHRLPGNRDNLSNAVELPRVIAMSAVEIPNELLDEYLQEYPNPTTLQNQIHNDQSNLPILALDYVNALKFCRWLSQRDGLEDSGNGLPPIAQIAPKDIGNIDPAWSESILAKDGYRLPTGIEWEIACRCGTVTSSFLGESDEYLSRYAWNSHNTTMLPMPVGMLAPNPWGFFDSLGNVYEMTLGSSTNFHYEVLDSTPLDYSIRDRMAISVRGGSFLSNRAYCVSGSKHGILATASDRNVGFRIVRTLATKPVDASEP